MEKSVSARALTKFFGTLTGGLTMFRRWKGLALALCLALICLPTISLAQDAFYFDYYYEETVTDEYYYDSYDAGYGGGWVETVYYLLPAINIGGCEYND